MTDSGIIFIFITTGFIGINCLVLFYLDVLTYIRLTRFYDAETNKHRSESQKP